MPVAIAESTLLLNGAPEPAVPAPFVSDSHRRLLEPQQGSRTGHSTLTSNANVTSKIGTTGGRSTTDRGLTGTIDCGQATQM
jgi:hypothetical protein